MSSISFSLRAYKLVQYDKTETVVAQFDNIYLGVFNDKKNVIYRWITVGCTCSYRSVV